MVYAARMPEIRAKVKFEGSNLAISASCRCIGYKERKKKYDNGLAAIIGETLETLAASCSYHVSEVLRSEKNLRYY